MTENFKNPNILALNQCPVTNLPITHWSEWTNIKISNKLQISYTLIGENILYVNIKGKSKTEDFPIIFKKRDLFLEESGLKNRKYVEIVNYNNSISIPSKEIRNQYEVRKKFEIESGKLIGYLVYNTSLIQRLMYKVFFKINPYPIPMYNLQDYKSSILKTIEILNSNNIFSESVTNEWCLKKDSFLVKFKLINGNILYGDFIGETRGDNLNEYFTFYGKVLKESGLIYKESCYRIVNWSNVKSTSWRDRKKYVKETNKYHSKLKLKNVVFIGLNKFMKVAVNIGKHFAHYPVTTANSLGEALEIINRSKQKEKRISQNNINNKKVKRVYSNEDIELYIKDLLMYIGKINWEKTGELNIPILEKNNPFLNIFEALSIIKYDFDMLVNEKEDFQKQMYQSARLASVGQLATGISHEINNPLTIILGNIERINEELKDLNIKNNKIIKMSKSLERASDRIFNIVKGLRVYGRKDSNEKDILNLHDVINDSVAIVNIVFEKEGIFINSNFKSKNPYIEGTLTKVQQIFMNLLTNAKDALKDIITKSILIETYDKNSSIVVQFSDNGSGMSDETVENVFDSFYTTKPPGEGTGLGLSIVHSIITEMKAEVEIKSKLNEGTTFILTFPKVDMKDYRLKGISRSDSEDNSGNKKAA
jgi:signal transduction histidine kinase